jgi:hypothetical protein
MAGIVCNNSKNPPLSKIAYFYQNEPRTKEHPKEKLTRKCLQTKKEPPNKKEPPHTKRASK